MFGPDLSQLNEKWNSVIDHPDLPKITDQNRRDVVAQVLENTQKEQRSYGEQLSLLGEAAPANAMGGSSSVAGDGSVDIFDPVMISLVRRSMPNLVSYDIMGTQPMTGPTGLIFAMRPRYESQTGLEALYNEANTSFSAVNDTTANTANFGNPVVDGAAGSTVTGNDPTQRASGSGYTVHQGMSTALAEALGDTTANEIAEMAFSIEKVTVTAKTRALKSEYTMELAQDLKAVHGLEAETELANILSAEVLSEINREAIRTVNYTATAGAQTNVATAGTFNLDVDSNGRWMAEKFSGLLYQIGRDANQISKSTRRGKGNIVICSSDVAEALSMTGKLDYSPALSNNLQVDDTGNTFAGVLNGRYKVYIDPYFATASGLEYYTVGYRGTNKYDAGIFYCPYVPLQMVRAVGENNFQPRIAFKTRYGMVANPFATTAADGSIAFSKKNIYYRIAAVENLM